MELQPSNHPKPQKCSAHQDWVNQLGPVGPGLLLCDNLEEIAEEVTERKTGKEEKKVADKAEKVAEKDADKEVFHVPLLPVHPDYIAPFIVVVFLAHFHLVWGLPSVLAQSYKTFTC